MKSRSDERGAFFILRSERGGERDVEIEQLAVASQALNMMLYVYFNERGELGGEGNDRKGRLRRFYGNLCAGLRCDPEGHVSPEEMIQHGRDLVERRANDIGFLGGTELGVRVKGLPKGYMGTLEGFDERTIVLHDLEATLWEFADYCDLIVLDGSLATGDYRPGWSDIDVFCAISDACITSPTAMMAARKVSLLINDLMHLWNVFQLHGLFVCGPSMWRFHTNIDMPVAAIARGMAFGGERDVKLCHSNTRGPRDTYLKRNVIDVSLRASRLEALAPREFVEVMHSVYSFPLAFLQSRGVYAYKREAFALMSTYCGSCPELEQNLAVLSDMYVSWPEDVRQRTWRERWKEYSGVRCQVEVINQGYMVRERDCLGYMRSFARRRDVRMAFDSYKLIIEGMMTGGKRGV